MMSGSGKSLPTKPLDAELNRQVQYNYDNAKENFIEKYPQIVEELGEDKINYSDLQDAGYDSEAEELSEMEMDYSGEDTIMMRVFAYYYSPENRRGENGKHTISLFGDVNLESPYHRAGNLDDSIEITFTFNSLDELSKKMDSNLIKIVGWFNGDNYNNSKKEMKVRRMADGGRIDLFEDYENIPDKVQVILDRYSDEFGGDGSEMDYKDTRNMLEEVESVGYTFGYGLDNEPYGLRPIGVRLNELKGFEDYDDNDYAKGGNVPTIEKRVAEVNALIERANKLNLSVVDTSGTWQAPMKYKPFKYSNGTLYEEYQELDLYKYNKGRGEAWETKKGKVLKSNMEFDSPLNDVARMYRKAINSFDKYGYADGGKIDNKDLEKLNAYWQSFYKGVMAGKKDEGYITITNKEELNKYITSKLGNVVKNIDLIEKGKNYPYNDSNPYYEDIYSVELKNGTTFKIVRSHGRPRWQGNVDYKEQIIVENIKQYADGGKTQGYDDREDERLAMKYGKMSGKDLNSTKARRDDARFEERGKMAKGGVTFDKKVSSISKSLLKRKKVSPSVQKDYGKTYNKSEAIDSAKRIVGSMTKMERAKKIVSAMPKKKN
jgi:hypothetical protein